MSTSFQLVVFSSHYSISDILYQLNLIILKDEADKKYIRLLILKVQCVKFKVISGQKWNVVFTVLFCIYPETKRL